MRLSRCKDRATEMGQRDVDTSVETQVWPTQFGRPACHGITAGIRLNHSVAPPIAIAGWLVD
jgi:hypothetical protein